MQENSTGALALLSFDDAGAAFSVVLKDRPGLRRVGDSGGQPVGMPPLHGSTRLLAESCVKSREVAQGRRLPAVAVHQLPKPPACRAGPNCKSAVCLCSG